MNVDFGAIQQLEVSWFSSDSWVVWVTKQVLCPFALLPLVKAELIDLAAPIVIEIKVGSSESGAEGNPGTHHAERANVIRTFSAFGHRHTAEVIQEMCVKDVSLTMTAVAAPAEIFLVTRSHLVAHPRLVLFIQNQRTATNESLGWKIA